MSKKKILLVDDSKVTRLSIKILLEKHDFEVLTFDNVEVFLTFAERYSDVSLILLDINLPGMDGLTALEYINKLPAVNHIPVIILSGHSDMGIVKRALSLNIIDYVIKPYIPSKLLARIEKVLASVEVTTEVGSNDTASPSDEKTNSSSEYGVDGKCTT